MVTSTNASFAYAFAIHLHHITAAALFSNDIHRRAPRFHLMTTYLLAIVANQLNCSFWEPQKTSGSGSTVMFRKIKEVLQGKKQKGETGEGRERRRKIKLPASGQIPPSEQKDTSSCSDDTSEEYFTANETPEGRDIVDDDVSSSNGSKVADSQYYMNRGHSTALPPTNPGQSASTGVVDRQIRAAGEGNRRSKDEEVATGTRSND